MTGFEGRAWSLAKILGRYERWISRSRARSTSDLISDQKFSAIQENRHLMEGGGGGKSHSTQNLAEAIDNLTLPPDSAHSDRDGEVELNVRTQDANRKVSPTRVP